jgi:hypothetical protein
MTLTDHGDAGSSVDSFSPVFIWLPSRAVMERITTRGELGFHDGLEENNNTELKKNERK